MASDIPFLSPSFFHYGKKYSGKQLEFHYRIFDNGCNFTLGLNVGSNNKILNDSRMVKF